MPEVRFKKYSISCFLLLFASIGYAQIFSIDSTRFIKGGLLFGAIPTADKGVLLMGEANGTVGGVLPYFPSTQAAFICKLDSNRQIDWVRLNGGCCSERAVSSCQTNDGGYAVLSSSGSNDLPGYKDAGDLWLLRTDNSGNELWQKMFGSSAFDLPASIINTPDNGFLILAITNGTDGDVTFRFGSLYYDWLLLKTDSTGALQWSRTLGGLGMEYPYGRMLAVDSCYYLVGTSNSRDNDCSDTSWCPGIKTYADIYLLKIDVTGNVMWSRSYGGSSLDGLSSALYDSVDGTIMIAGYTESNDFMVTGSDHTRNGWVLKVDRNGNVIWQKRYENGKFENISDICIYPGGGYLLFGSTGPSTGPSSEVNAWITLIDNSGNLIAEKEFGGVLEEFPWVVLPVKNGILAAGFTNSYEFIEGLCNGSDMGQKIFISYLGYDFAGVEAVFKDKDQLHIFPDPANGSTNVKFPSGKSGGTLTVTNTLGQKVLEMNIKENEEQVELKISEWHPGLFIVKWQVPDGLAKVAILTKYGF